VRSRKPRTRGAWRVASGHAAVGAGDHQPLDLRGALEEGGDLGIAVPLLHEEALLCRAAGSSLEGGRTVLACSTPSRKRPSTNSAPESTHGSAVLIDSRLRWLRRLPLVLSRHATASTVPRCQGQGGIARAVFRVAVSGRRDQEASFFTVIVWRDQAEHASQSLSKAAGVVVVGRLQQRSWTAQDGGARSAVEVVAEELGPACDGRRPCRSGPPRGRPRGHRDVGDFGWPWTARTDEVSRPAGSGPRACAVVSRRCLLSRCTRSARPRHRRTRF
jgi:hypothetical protein